MACPYFYPVERDRHDLGTAGSRLPLGDAWVGRCHAPGLAAWPGEMPLPVCQLGYARGRCDRFPSGDDGADAVRFAVRADDGALIALYYVLERDHHPFAHGPLEYSLTAGCFLLPPASETIRRQAEAYVQSYLRRKSGARVAAESV